MSGSLVPHWLQQPSLAQHRVGAPVSGTHGMQWVDAASFLLGECVSPIINTGSLFPSTADREYYCACSISPGAQVLRIEVELQFSTVDGGASAFVTVNLSGALSGATWITANGLDGSQLIYHRGAIATQGPFSVVGWLDVSACTKNTPAVLHISLEDNEHSQGLRRLCIQEVPLATLQPLASVSLESGIDTDWPNHTNKGILSAGDSSTADGTYRVLSQLEAARKKVRRHLQLMWGPAVTGGSTPQITGTTFGLPFGDGSVEMYLRTRAVYGTSVANKYRAWITYNVNDASGAVLRVAHTPIGGSTTNTDLTLANTSGSWSTIDAGAVNIATSGTNQEAKLNFQLKAGAGGVTVYTVHAGLIEDED